MPALQSAHALPGRSIGLQCQGLARGTPPDLIPDPMAGGPPPDLAAACGERRTHAPGNDNKPPPQGMPRAPGFVLMVVD